MIRSIGVFLSFCLASTLLRIPPFGLNNIQEFMIYIVMSQDMGDGSVSGHR